MKISVNWLFDHIATKVSKVDVGLIAAKFNVHTAEIEHYEKHDIALQDLFLVTIGLITDHNITVFCKELDQQMILPLRKDLQEGQFAFVRRLGLDFSWEKLSVYSACKEGLFPAVDCQESLVAGGWKNECESTDYIIEVDNKSINHRPDLWGHRGIAREVAAFMGWKLKSIDEMLAQVPEVDFVHTSIIAADHTLKLSIKDNAVCSRFAGLFCQNITHKPSQIWMAIRLARVDSKPINSIVDITNYVMFDISQPMHVFDAANFADKKLEVRKALSDEQLELLDGRAIHLTDQDIVVTDGVKPVALAGVMGGKQASFSSNAQAIIIEAGNFAAAMVRNSAARAKVSTEASIRFAKQLDSMQNTVALQRFIFIAQAIGVVQEVAEKVVSVGKQIESAVIPVSHAFIEHKLGITLSSDQIITLLEKLDFQIMFEQAIQQERSFMQKWFGFMQEQVTVEQDMVYQVQVPTYRMTKDITIAEDIVEEIARLYGFDNITYQRPNRVMKTFDMSNVIKLRTIKQHCAFAMRMREVKDYLFYDESFLRRLNWYPTDAVAIKNPVSENWKVLVTSLIPHLIKNVELNAHGHPVINLFEHNNIWKAVSSEQASEHKSLAGIFFGDKALNFYDYKAQLQDFFAILQMHVVWSKPVDQVEPWFDQLQVSDLVLDGIIIGRAGMICPSFIKGIVKGVGFVFELRADLLMQYQPKALQFKPWSKYQAVHADISLLVDATVTAVSLQEMIAQLDPHIDQVTLVDFFEKEEWVGKRSLTLRYRICSFEQNINKEMIDTICNKVIAKMTEIGAQVR